MDANINPCVLVVTHKSNVFIESEIFRPISVNRSVDNPSWLRDDQGENISQLNSFFCELTAVYWAWKNLNKSYTHVGIMHYRRGLALNPGLFNIYKKALRLKIFKKCTST